MRNYLIGFTALILLLVPLAVSGNQDNKWQLINEPIRKSDTDPRQYQAIKLANQMTVLIVSDKDAVKSLAALVLPIGALDDPRQQQGLAHYTEHMIFLGSKKYPELDNLDQFLRKNGGDYNASTSYTSTYWFLEVENSALEPAVDRLADAIAMPLFTPAYADRERYAVNAELTRARSNEGFRMRQVSAETTNPVHPVAGFAGGNLDTLSDKPNSKLQDELIKFHYKYYSANLMKGVIYGSRPFNELAAIAAKTFGRIPNRQATVPAIDKPLLTPAQKGVAIHYVPEEPLNLLKIEFMLNDNTDKFANKTDMLIGYLIRTRTQGTLADWLQSQGLIELINVDYNTNLYRDNGPFSIVLTLTEKGLAQRDKVVAAVFSYLELLRQQPIDQRYFDELAGILNINFRYPAINRDMIYVANLAENMLLYPIAHIQDGGIFANKYDPQALKHRLKQMTVHNARIWYIHATEPHNRKAYFFDSLWQMDKIADKKFVAWQHMGQQFNFSLPRANPWIPDDASLIPAEKNAPDHPVPLENAANIRLYRMPSRYFADRPRVSVVLALRSQLAFNTVQDQLLFLLNKYLAGIAVQEMSDQAAVAGVDIATAQNSGLEFSLNGFSQHVPKLLINMVQTYATYPANEQQFAQAKAALTQQLIAEERGSASEQAFYPLGVLPFLPYFEVSARRQVLKDITLQQLFTWRTNLLKSVTPEMLVVGNLTRETVVHMAEEIKKCLPDSKGDLWRDRYLVIDKPLKVNLEKAGNSSDSALVAFYLPLGYSENQAIAHTMLFSQIVQNWFFNQIRTEEQLGYDPAVFWTSIGRQFGIGFSVQSNRMQPAQLLARFQAFYPVIEQRLREMSADEFSQYQRAALETLKQRPQTLIEEAQRFSHDFERGNQQFDTRQKVIDWMQQLDAQQLADFFQRSVVKQEGLMLLSQLSGNEQKSRQYAEQSEWKKWTSIEALQRSLPTHRDQP